MRFEMYSFEDSERSKNFPEDFKPDFVPVFVKLLIHQADLMFCRIKVFN